ncbi:MAG: hypothetical protein ACKO8I_07165 [Cyanobacteriota bacterium]
MGPNSRLVGNAPAFAASLLCCASALGSLLLIGCAALWNPAQRGGLDADVHQLLSAAGVTPAQLDCRMLGATRDGECTLRLPPSAAGALIRGLRLEAIPADAAATSSLSLLVRLKGPGCAAALSGPIERHGSADRPALLRLAGGSAFEYLLLSFDSRSQQACLQVSYAYG